MGPQCGKNKECGLHTLYFLYVTSIILVQMLITSCHKDMICKQYSCHGYAMQFWRSVYFLFTHSIARLWKDDYEMLQVVIVTCTVQIGDVLFQNEKHFVSNGMNTAVLNASRPTWVMLKNFIFQSVTCQHRTMQDPTCPIFLVDCMCYFGTVSIDLFRFKEKRSTQVFCLYLLFTRKTTKKWSTSTRNLILSSNEMKNKVLVEFVVKTVFEGFFHIFFPNQRVLKTWLYWGQIIMWV